MRPPKVSTTVEPRLRDVPRIAWWFERGYVHGALHGRGLMRLGHLITAFFVGVLFPLVVLAQWLLLKRSTARYYMTPERDAVFALVARHGGTVWVPQDHAAARIGAGLGRRLRQHILSELLPVADRAGIEVRTWAADRRLAQIYAADLPGLTGRGLRLRRPAADLTSAERARVERILDAVAARTGVDRPELRFRRTIEQVVQVRPHWTRRGAHVIVMPLTVVRTESDESLEGTLGHECQHIVAGDGRRRDVARSVFFALSYVLAAVWVPLGLAALMQTATGKIGFAVLIWFAAMFPFFALMLRLIEHAPTFTRAAAGRSRCCELRCDLAAVRVLGREPVEAMLNRLARYDAERKQIYTAWASHPSPAVRRAAVAAYDGTTDPDVAATAFLTNA